MMRLQKVYRVNSNASEDFRVFALKGQKKSRKNEDPGQKQKPAKATKRRRA
jgi:hypothetical protein